MDIWKSLDLYRDRYALPDSKWHAMAITVDKKVNRDVFYVLGPNNIVNDISTYLLADGSCDFEHIMREHLGVLELCFILNNRNGVVDIYKSNGIFDDMRIPVTVHMSEFVQAIMTLTGTTEDKLKPIPYNGININGNVATSGRDSIADNGDADEAWKSVKGIDFSQALISEKYSPSKVRTKAAIAAGAKVDIKKVKASGKLEKVVNNEIFRFMKKMFGGVDTTKQGVDDEDSTR